MALSLLFLITVFGQQDFKYADLSTTAKINALQSDHDEWIDTLKKKKRVAEEEGNNNEYLKSKSAYKDWLKTFNGKKIKVLLPVYKVDGTSLRFKSITRLNQLDKENAATEHSFIDMRFLQGTDNLMYRTSHEDLEFVVAPLQNKDKEVFSKLKRGNSLIIEFEVTATSGVYILGKTAK